MRVILAEDSTLLREGIIRLLDEANITVLAAVSDGEQLLKSVKLWWGGLFVERSDNQT